MIKRFSSLLLSLMILASVIGCRREGPPPPGGNKPSSTTWTGHGIIRDIAADRSTVTIQHDAIAGYMGAMTMDFPVRDTNVLTSFVSGDEITFQLVVNDTNDWVQDLQLVAHHIADVTNDEVIFHVPTDELKVGDAMPDATLITEAGQTVKLSDFRGHVVAFTFFFTSCPLPDFCPKMNRNIAEARDLLLAEEKGTNGTAADKSATGGWQFLSISFDPMVDKPALLTAYANMYRGGDTNRWLFAVADTNSLAMLAPALDLHFWRENGSISHNLRTVVLDPTGHIAKQFDGNNWTASDLVAAIRAAQKVKF